LDTSNARMARRSAAMEASSASVAALSLPVPRVDVRVVLFTVVAGKLFVALTRDDESTRLPKGEPRSDEALDSVATRVLAQEKGIEERYLEQLYSVSGGSRDDWTVTVAYLGLALAGNGLAARGVTSWFEVTGLPAMNALDRKIVDYALLRLRAKLGYTTIAFHLLPRTFSLSELQQVYEAVLHRKLDKRNFRRRIQSGGFLEPTGEARREGSHRPARLFRFRAAHDAETYLTPAWVSNLDGELATQ
jgi:8-oxo-dGTP diphosphatase